VVGPKCPLGAPPKCRKSPEEENLLWTFPAIRVRSQRDIVGLLKYRGLLDADLSEMQEISRRREPLVDFPGN
jgi:hypothetical protein